MKRISTHIHPVLNIFLILPILLLVSTCSDSSPLGPGGESGNDYFTIDHSCSVLPEIPLEWIDSVQSGSKLHYAHTSHGGQLTVGLLRIETADSTYSVSIGSRFLPDENNALCIFDGQESETYITPDLFWESEEGMNLTRSVLNNNTDINVCMWCWCCQMDSYGEAEVQAYLDSMTVLESDFPNVTFVYMTGNAQATGAEGYNRYLRNQQIRQYCQNNNRILYDFADLDCWYNSAGQWEQHTYSYNGNDIPSEHPQFYGNESGHTTYESCEQKGRSVWWLLAMIEGW
ncbi:MAG: hypothetical protein K8R76_09125 [Candidatus Aegiribacteria sp.]|nr:hypothetical protein [Candidatus Aegiribacteria sp.]